MDATDGAVRGIGAADLERKADCKRRVRFIREKVLIGAVEIAGEFLRPVALLARFASGAEITDGRLDGMGVVARHHSDELMDAVHLRLHKRFRAVADMAGDAIHASVRAVLVGGELRLHRHVAGLTAKRDGLADVIALVAADGGAEQKDDAAQDEDDELAAVAGTFEVNVQDAGDGDGCAEFFLVTALKPDAQDNHPESEK